MSEPIFLSRNELGMASPRSISRNIAPERGGVMPHWGGGPQKVTTLDKAVSKWLAWQRMHIAPGGIGTKNGGSDIAYNIGFWREYVFAGRGESTRSGANGTNDANTRFLAMVWIGGAGETPTEQDYATADWILDKLRSGGAGNEVKPHRSVRPTSCPGPDWTEWASVRDGRLVVPRPPVDEPQPKPEPAPQPKPEPAPQPKPEPAPQTWTEQLVKNLPTRRRRTDLSQSSNWDRRIQGLLAAAGVLNLSRNTDGGTFDGKFGASTEMAVRAFQHRSGLAVDGIIGPKTWTKLLGR